MQRGLCQFQPGLLWGCCGLLDSKQRALHGQDAERGHCGEARSVCYLKGMRKAECWTPLNKQLFSVSREDFQGPSNRGWVLKGLWMKLLLQLFPFLSCSLKTWDKCSKIPVDWKMVKWMASEHRENMLAALVMPKDEKTSVDKNFRNICFS